MSEQGNVEHDLAQQAVAALTAAARRTRIRGAGTGQETTEPADFAEIACHVITAVAANAGGVEQLLAGRPGSWEADLIRRIVEGTAGDHLDSWRTEAMRLQVDVGSIFEDLGIQQMAYAEEEAAIKATCADGLTEDEEARADALATAIELLREHDKATYFRAYQAVVQRHAHETGIKVLVLVNRIADYTSYFPDGYDGTAARLHEYARNNTPLPMTGQPPAATAEATVDAIRASGRTYTARARAELG